MDIFTPGASKASGSSTAASAQILKVLECTSNALVNIAAKENARRQKEERARQVKRNERKRVEAEERARKGLPPLRDDQQGAEEPNAVKPLDVDKALSAAGKVSGAAAAMDSERAKLDTAEKKESSDAGGKPSPAAQTVGTLLKMTGGMSPTGAPATGAPAAASVQANKASAPAATGASSGSEKSKPANNTFEPLSHAPVGATGTSLSSPLRMQENLHADAAHSHHLNNEAEATEQQRNYASFKQKQAESASAGGHSFDPSTGASGHNAEGQHTSARKREPEQDALPLFIIDGFNAENASKHSNFLNTLVAWSAEMSAAGAARFVYLTDAGLEESVAKSLPDVHLAEVVLSDASPEAAQEFLFASLPPRMRAKVPRGDPQTLSALRILGGRYNDLLQLVRGMENGAHPVETVEEIVVQAMGTVKGLLFTEDKNVKWSKVQMWMV